MGRIFDTLTWQGKAAVAGMLLIGLVLFGLCSGGGGSPNRSNSLVIQPQVPTFGVTSIPSPTVAAQSPTGVPSSTPALPTPTSPAATATRQTLTAGPESPTPAPTAQPTSAATPATPAPSCSAIAGVSNPNPARSAQEIIAAKLTCGDSGVGGAQMTATVHYKTSTSTCSGVSDSSGVASCTLRTGDAPGFVSIDACFVYKGQSYCGQTGFTLP